MLLDIEPKARCYNWGCTIWEPGSTWWQEEKETPKYWKNEMTHKWLSPWFSSERVFEAAGRRKGDAACAKIKGHKGLLFQNYIGQCYSYDANWLKLISKIFFAASLPKSFFLMLRQSHSEDQKPFWDVCWTLETGFMSEGLPWTSSGCLWLRNIMTLFITACLTGSLSPKVVHHLLYKRCLTVIV